SGELKDRDPALNVNAYNLIANNFGPYQPKDIQFPRWLEYSPINDAAFCFYCRCFPPSNKYNELAYTLHGFKTWSRATKSFKDHENSASHKEASVKVSGFRSSKKVGNIASNGIAIRGHNESEDSLNKGNFLELLHLRAKNNNILQEYFLQKEHHYRYTNGTYLNEFIDIMSSQVIRNITLDIRKANIYSILIDETQDLSRHEQVAFIIRHVDEVFEPKEVFLGFYKTNRTDGETLANLVKEVLRNNNLQIENLRGQCYDGAAAMRGRYNGVQAKIREINPLAMYVHCYAHILNLCLIDLAKQLSYVRNTFGSLQSLHNFIGASSKRNAIFETIQSETACTSKSVSLKSLCETRWNCRTDALNSVFTNFSTIINTLEHISDNDITPDLKLNHY
ncbi:zinc finger MYM-type protein 1-like, partial [Myzus persicae]|uniref:zinc finger MYM-type protein 1-like n=1 Tax=Myzus persicae TaxID=13164 RepID=UPI000B93729E